MVIVSGQTLCRPHTVPTALAVNLLWVHKEVNDGIDRGIDHSQPVKCQEDVLNVGKCPYARKVVGVEEVNVVWQPTNSKYHNKNQKHFDNLQKRIKKSNNCMIFRKLCKQQVHILKTQYWTQIDHNKFFFLHSIPFPAPEIQPKEVVRLSSLFQ